MPVRRDITGQIFGRLTALYDTNRKDAGSHSIWHCRCSCGNEVDVSLTSLTSGHSKSCGCLRKTNGDLTGRTFGMLTVLRYTGKDGRWLCRCECGKETVATASCLVRGLAKSCGCRRRNDLTGQVFGRLTVLYDTGRNNKDYRSIWHCRCSCGNEVDVTGHRLTSGNKKSCGCLRKTRYRGS